MTLYDVSVESNESTTALSLYGMGTKYWISPTKNVLRYEKK